MEELSELQHAVKSAWVWSSGASSWALLRKGLCDDVSLVSLKRMHENLRVLAFQSLFLRILSVPQSMSSGYYLKFLLAVSQGYGYCRSHKLSCVHKLGNVEECSN